MAQADPFGDPVSIAHSLDFSHGHHFCVKVLNSSPLRSTRSHPLVTSFWWFHLANLVFAWMIWMFAWPYLPVWDVLLMRSIYQGYQIEYSNSEFALRLLVFSFIIWKSLSASISSAISISGVKVDRTSSGNYHVGTLNKRLNGSCHRDLIPPFRNQLDMFRVHLIQSLWFVLSIEFMILWLVVRLPLFLWVQTLFLLVWDLLFPLIQVRRLICLFLGLRWHLWAGLIEFQILNAGSERIMVRWRTGLTRPSPFARNALPWATIFETALAKSVAEAVGTTGIFLEIVCRKKAIVLLLAYR
jgi:hypothetical protein